MSFLNKPIKIHKDHQDAIEAALKTVNGKAIAHVFNTYGEIYELAQAAEKQLTGLGIPKQERGGARFIARSGSRLPSSYKYTAIATSVELIRRTSGWYLSAVSPSQLHSGSGAPHPTLYLTVAQDAKAVEVLRRSYIREIPKAEPVMVPSWPYVHEGTEA